MRAQHAAAILDALVDQLPYGVVVVDVEGRVTMINEEGRRLIGVPDPLVPLPQHLSRYASQSDGREIAPEETVPARALSGEVCASQHRLVRHPASGEEQRLEASASPIRDESGAIAGALVLLHEAAGPAAHADQRDELFASIAHDLKNPLTTIRGVAHLMGQRIAHDDADKERLLSDISKLEGAVMQMNRLINEFLDGLAIEMGRPLDLFRHRVDLVGIVRRSVMEQQQRAPNHRITLCSALPELFGQWDGLRLDRVLTNLLSNAIKYSPEGGEITVGLACPNGTSEPCAVITVVDQGIGIPGADLPHVFERFYRGSNVTEQIAGTGVGLTGVRQIVEQHGGMISVMSAEGSGSTFTVRLPLAPCG
jgi:signal transduction histidine kinase